MNKLATLNDQLAAIRAEQSKASAQLGDIAAERFELEQNPSGKAARIAAAETELIEQLTQRELGEPADVPAAEKALEDAKALPDDRFETATRLRVLDALRARHEGEHVALHAKGIVLMAAIRAAETEAIAAMGADLLVETETAISAVARNACLLDACRNLVAERGATWPHAILREAEITLRHQISPNAARASVLAELNA